MADLTVFQKYPKAGEDQSGPKSMRLDYQNFGDVCRSTFAKGVITDFEKVHDNPIKVNSRVKIKIGDGEESDFIPIFFHPAKLYWDDAGTPPSPHAATDFNTTGKYHEKAWMSFRCGDEVAVLLQAPAEGGDPVPVFVIAFADGVPRIGEDVFKITTPPFWVQVSKAAEYTAHDVGPDGIDLGLETECERVVIEESSRTYDGGYSLFGHTDGWYESGWPGHPEWFTEHFYDFPCTRTTTQNIYYYIIPIGPILYIFITETWRDYDSFSYREYGLNYSTTGGPTAPDATPAPIVHDPYAAVDIRATIYNDINLSAARSNNLDNFVVQSSLYYLLFIGIEPNINTEKPDLQIKVRPHTKVDLQAADMWPAGATP